MVALTVPLAVIARDQVQPREVTRLPASAGISYGLVVDNSASLREQIGYVIEAAKALVNSNRPGDETFLVRFIGRKTIQRLVDITPDKNAVIDAVDDFFIEGGQTAIVDAMYESARYLAQNNKAGVDDPRRALVLITDGEDRDSRRKPEELLGLLREKKIRVYAIGLTGNLKRDRGLKTYERAVGLLGRLANESGGRAYFPKTASELSSAVDEVSEELHKQ